jgi:hypothetical protein
VIFLRDSAAFRKWFIGSMPRAEIEPLVPQRWITKRAASIESPRVGEYADAH